MKKSYLFAGISIFCWSTIATVSKLLLGTMNSYQLLMCSALFATVALLVVAAVNGKIKLLRTYRVRDYLLILLTGLPGTALYYVFLYNGTARILASQAFIINYLWPIMSVLFAFLLLGEALTAKKCVAFALSFLGVLTIAGADLLRFNLSTLVGMLFCVLAAVSYGAFTALGRKYVYDDTVSMMLSFAATFVVALLIHLGMGEPLHVGGWQLLGIAWNGIFVLALATVTWMLALKQGGAAKISNLAYITPFLSLVWTFFVLKEPIEPFSVVGLSLIVLGILIQLRDKKRLVGAPTIK